MNTTGLIGCLMMISYRTILIEVEGSVGVGALVMTPLNVSAGRVEGPVIIQAILTAPSPVIATTPLPLPLPLLSAIAPTLPQIFLIVSTSRILAACPAASVHVSACTARFSQALSLHDAGTVGVVAVVVPVVVAAIVGAAVNVADIVVTDIACVAVSVCIPVRSDVRAQRTSSPLIARVVVVVSSSSTSTSSSSSSSSFIIFAQSSIHF